VYIGPGRDGPKRNNGSWRLPPDRIFSAFTSFQKGMMGSVPKAPPLPEEVLLPEEPPGQAELSQLLLQEASGRRALAPPWLRHP
jgi:hypothetical protein